MPPTRAQLGPPPTNELGAPGLASYGGWLDTWEETPELQFPNSVRVFDRMRIDGQVAAVVSAGDLPLRRARPRMGVPGDGVDERVRRFLVDELGIGLDSKSAGRRRRRNQGVVWTDFYRHALLKRWFGFMPFEQVYAVDVPGPGQDGLGLPRQTAHLRKLGPRMPRSLIAVDVARDGGLNGIRQTIPAPGTNGMAGSPTGFQTEATIPAARLAYFCHDREGGDWYGRSALRASYGHWLIKQMLLKLGPMIAERNGMGVPVVNHDDTVARGEALQIAKGFRAGEESGVALPVGATLSLVGVTGTLKDELPLLKYHDEAMGRAALAMFLNLGHDNGARSLGETFVDYFAIAEEAEQVYHSETITEYVIRDLVELNFGPDEPYPVLTFDELTPDSEPTAEALNKLATAGLLDADPDVKDEIRRRFRLPVADRDAEPAPAVAPGFDPNRVTPPALPGPTGGAIAPEVTDPPASLAARLNAIATRAAALAQAEETRQAAELAAS